MAIRMMVHCRKCNREFDWNNDEGYAKMPDGSYLCSIFCDLKETLDRLALAMEAIEAADRVIGSLVGIAAAQRAKMPVSESLFDRADGQQAKYLELRKKLEESR